MLETLAPIAMVEVSIDGYVSWANERWCELVGAHSIHALDRLWHDMVHPDEQPRVVEVWRASTSAGERFTMECRLSVPGQKKRWIEVHAAPSRELPTGTTVYVLAVLDVTEKKAWKDMVRTTTDLENWAEQSAATLSQQSRELGIFAALVASSADAIAIIEPDATLRYFNKSFQLLFDVQNGISYSELMTIMGMDDSTQRALKDASTADESWESVVRLERPQRGTLHAELNCFSIMDETARRIGWALIVRDLSAHKEVEAERERLNAEIIAAQESAIRELSTPLLPIGPGILAMPLIGNIDVARGRRILDTLLAGIYEYQATVAILDVTGVRQINADVAEVLVRSAQAANLLGTTVLLTGVGPVVAKTLIQIGVDLSRIRTLANLEQGIRTAFTYTRTHKNHNRRNGHPFSTK